MGWILKRNKTSINGEWMVSPTNKVSFKDTAEEDFAEALKTALILVVVLDSFLTAWMGR